MKFFFFLVGLLLTAQTAYTQDAVELYRKADSVYKLKNFTSSAALISEGIRLEGDNADIGRYLSAAASWSMARNTDSAFAFLHFISTAVKTRKTTARNIEYGADFIPIAKDKRWLPLVKKINERAEKNAYPQEEFIYGRKDGMALTLVCIKPKVKANGKGIISVQSGGWYSNYNGIEATAGIQFLEKGFTVFAVYHGSTPRYAIPDAVVDLKRAVRYTRYHAKKFGIDPDHIGITGGSAGGHLSLMIATADDKINETAPDPVDRVSSRVQAVAVLFPPTDLLNWGAPGMNLINAKELLKQRGSWGIADFRIYHDKFRIYEEVTDTSARNRIGRYNSPVYHVSPDDPPVFIIHGDADLTVPVQQSLSIIEKFKEAGVTQRLVIKKGRGHSDHMNPEYQEFAAWFEKYLQ